MAKRRNLRSESKGPEELTPEERRALRKRGRSPKAKARRSGRRLFGALVAGGVAAAIAVVLVVLLVFLPAHPCLTFSAPPGPPVFPPAGTTQFNGTWCPQNAPLVYQIRASLTISITGTAVPIPNAIGRNSSYGSSECDLPIRTLAGQPGEPPGTIHIDSDWAYSYNLSDFFGVWSRSYPTAFVNASHPNQPITYSRTSLLGFSADANHVIDLFVDNALSSAGPSLDLTTLDWGTNPYPSCLANQYGTGHLISLQYRAATAGAARMLPAGTPGATAAVPAAEQSPGQESPGTGWNGPLAVSLASAGWLIAAGRTTGGRSR